MKRLRSAALGWRMTAAVLLGAGPAAFDAAAAGPAVTPPVVAAGPVERQGAWKGGPEPVSGKLRSGIVTWYRIATDPPRAGVPFEVRLRFEDVRQPGATASLSTSDGARFASAAMPVEWALPQGVPSELTLKMQAPAGHSYLHVLTRQQGKVSMRTFVLERPGADHALAEKRRRDYSIDASGEPIVRMPAAR